MSNPPVSAPRPLSVLRAMIDSVDRDILNLLARRAALVGEIAECKRHHRLEIRDRARESQIVRDRREFAAELGLSPNVVEGMYRLILWESRDRQAALRAEVPLDAEPKTIAIVGGMGQMGQCLADRKSVV